MLSERRELTFTVCLLYDGDVRCFARHRDTKQSVVSRGEGAVERHL